MISSIVSNGTISITKIKDAINLKEDKGDVGQSG